jgi:hypothetical protein
VEELGEAQPGDGEDDVDASACVAVETDFHAGEKAPLEMD